MTDTNANLVLLPWLRRGGTSALTQPDSLGADQPGVATATASLAVNNAPPITMPVRLMGPGHVTGLQTTQVIRMDPTPGSRGFEPNYFPLVEFDEPSLPWLFTPARPTPTSGCGRGSASPWCASSPACCCHRRAAARCPSSRSPRPPTPTTELPDLGRELGLGAHPGHRRAAGARTRRRDRPGGERADPAAARIAPIGPCATRVRPRPRPSTEYVACVVPTFELGRLAGLGLDIPAGEEEKLRPSWTLGDDLLCRAARLPLVGVRHRRQRRLQVTGDAAARPPAADRGRPAPDRRLGEQRRR